eukprot:scaffold104657_cov42-Prasinocladus_malaysianus.AAC.1
MADKMFDSMQYLKGESDACGSAGTFIGRTDKDTLGGGRKNMNVNINTILLLLKGTGAST